MQVSGSFAKARLLSVILLVVIGCAWSSASWGCSCFAERHSDAFRHADLVFEGVLVSSTEVSAQDTDDTALIDYIFDLTRPIKGLPKQQRTIRGVIPTGGNCAMPFDEGSTYRVYARRYSGSFWTSGCSYSRHMGEPGETEANEFYEEWEDDDRIILFDPSSSDRERERALEDLVYLQVLRQNIEESERFLDRYVQQLASAMAADASRNTTDYAIGELQEFEDFGNLAVLFEALAERSNAAAYYSRQAGDAFSAAREWEAAIAAYRRSLSIDRTGLAAQHGLARARLVAAGVVDPLVKNYAGIQASVVTLTDYVGRDVDLSGLATDELNLAGSRIRNFQLEGGDVDKGDWSDAKLPSARLDRLVSLKGIKFAGIDLRNAKLRDGWLPDADFSHSDLSGADFTGTEMSAADLTVSRLRGTNFQGASLS
ncbi:MAG: pentapeptide repeat-containing protein, partial [Parvularculaceae bacterium]|nr:pentapeptide repeat-containing protein [Parvularculaceae bacterium]